MWKYGYASVAGASHLKSGLPCQDASVVAIASNSAGEEILIVIASDGAGSAAFAQIGSRMACDLFLSEVKNLWEAKGDWGQFGQDFFTQWPAKFQAILQAENQHNGQKLNSFACTFLIAIVGREQAIFVQIGDGAMVKANSENPNQYNCVCWPQQGEYANTTNFLTDADAAAKMFYAHVQEQVDEVALFTDGLQNLVLDYRTQTAHSPYFSAFFNWLRPRPLGYSRELSEALIVYLNSEKVNARTDDDKTLILASRI